MNTSLDTVLQVLRWVLNTLFHQCLAVIAIYAIWVAVDNYYSPISWHVILCTLGVFPLMAEAFILFSADNVWSQNIERKQKFYIHGILIFIASFFIITGISLVINHKRKADATHFSSGHAITGLIAMIFLIFTLISGPLAVSSPFAKFKDIWAKLLHNLLGQFTYLMLIICLCLAFYMPHFKLYTSDSSRAAATIVTVLVAIWSMVCSFKSLYLQIKTMRQV